MSDKNLIKGQTYYYRGNIYYICNTTGEYINLSKDQSCLKTEKVLSRNELEERYINRFQMNNNKLDLRPLYNDIIPKMKLDIFTRDNIFSKKENLNNTINFIKKFIVFLSEYNLYKDITFHNNVKVSVLGTGSFGSAFLLQGKDTEYVVKVQACDDPAFENELKFMKLANRIRYNDKIHYLPKIYGSTKFNNMCIIIMEKADGTLRDLNLKGIKNNPYSCEPIKKYKSIFQQIVISIYLVHKYVKVVHLDVKDENIFYFKKAPIPSIQIKDKIYKIENCGFRLVLFDYGLSHPIDTYNKYRNKKVNAYDDYEIIKYMMIPDKIKSHFEPFFKVYLTLEPSFSYTKIAMLLLNSLL